MSEKKSPAQSAGKDRTEAELKKQPTTDPKLSDSEKTPGSGMMPDAGGAPSG